MVMTTLEARVEPGKWATLEAAYKAGTRTLPPGIVRAYLAHSNVDPDLWRMMALWESREAVEQMRDAGGPPPGALIFRAAGVEPVMSVFDVVGEVSR